MSWGVFEYHDSNHVIPLDDIEDHYFIGCNCGVKYIDGIYVHNSFDGREVLEQMEINGEC